MTRFLCSRLVGRADELAALHDLVRASAAGNGRAHALVGAPGLGKTRLVREAVTAAGAAAVVAAVGRCSGGPATAPLRPLSEAVTALVRGRTTPDDAALRPYLPVLGRLAPDLLPTGADASAPDPDPVHLGEGLLRLLEAHGRGRGALLVVEDVQDGDTLTLAVLEHVADALAAPAAGVGLSLLLTLRPDRCAGRDVVDTLVARRSVQTSVLQALPDPQVEELVRACAPGLPGPVVQAVVQRAGGVPFLAEELLSAAADEVGHVDPRRVAEVVPLSLADAVHRRAVVLQPDVRELLLLAALVGRSADPALLAAATGAATERVVRALQPARAAGLLADDDPCAFRHALTRDAVLAAVLPAERAVQARRLLQAVEGVPTEPTVLAQLAEAAGDAAAAARGWLAAGEEALRRGLPDSAQTALRQAHLRAEEARDRGLAGAVAVRRLAALALAGRADEVLQLCDGLRAAGRLEPQVVAELHLHAARAALDAGQRRRAERELARCGSDDASALALGALVALADDRLEQAQARAQRVLDLPQPPPAAVCEAWEVLGRLRRPRDLAGARAAFEAGHRTACAAGLVLWEVRALHELGTIEMFLTGRPDRLEDAHRAATAVGALTVRAVLDMQIASCHALALEPEAALERAAAAARVAEQTGARPLAAAAAVTTAHAHAYAGRWADAAAAAERARALADEDPETLAMLAGLLDGLGGLLDEDRLRAARGFAELGRLVPLAPRMPPTPAQALRVLLATVDRTPDAPQARAQADAAGVATAPYNALLLAYADAVGLGQAGKAAAAERRVREADAALQALDPGPVVQRLRALGLRLMAQAALRDGWGEPVPWLREAVLAFEQRAPAVAHACRALLRQAGAQVARPRAGDGVPPALRVLGVTAREHEVLLLVASGASNREVAAHLHLSTRTVETHVARLLDKTGATTRVDLAPWGLATT